MSLFLPQLRSKEEVDAAVRGVAEKVLVLRFGREEDPVCLHLDHTVRHERDRQVGLDRRETDR